MTIPHAHNAKIPDRKLLDYLLNHAHPPNKGKAAFYAIVGFTKENAEDLRLVLLSHLVDNEIAKFIHTELRVRYVVEGQMHCPNGKNTRFGRYGLLKMARRFLI